jgi:hypothetical protein
MILKNSNDYDDNNNRIIANKLINIEKILRLF